MSLSKVVFNTIQAIDCMHHDPNVLNIYYKKSTKILNLIMKKKKRNMATT